MKNKMTREELYEYVLDCGWKKKPVNLSDMNLARLSLEGLYLAQANLSSSSFIASNLSASDLSQSNMSGACFYKATLLRTNCSGADMQRCNLDETNFRFSNLESANLSNTDLRTANLRNTFIRGANLSNTKLPTPQMILSANWGEVSDELAMNLMRYNATSIPDGMRLYTDWAKGRIDSPRPNTSRWDSCAADFVEVKELWSVGSSKSPVKLAEMLLDKYCPGWR